MNSSPLANQIAGLLSRKSSQSGATMRSARRGFAAACAALAASLAAAVIGVSAPADASVFNYGTAGSTHTVNAGILQLDSAKQIVAGQLPNSTSGTNDAIPKTSGALYSFYVLDQRADYKPAGWRFTNPLAPTTVTSDIQALFSANYTLGQQITPSMAAYWMVNLPSVTAGYVPGATNPLSQYDILVIRAAGKVIGLSRAEREVLRDYVDQGGTLWIEDAGNADTLVIDNDAGGGDTPAGLFVDAAFHDSSNLAGAPYVSDADHRHPTLTEPNFLSYPELAGLSYLDNGVFPDWISSQAGLDDKPDFDFLSIVVGNTDRMVGTTAQPVIAAGDFGSGHVVIDDCNILGGVSDAVVGSATDTGFAPANLAAAQSSDLQYAYNVISWSGAESTTDGGDVRHTGAQTTAEIGSSLLPSWVYPDTRVTPDTTVVDGKGVAISGNIAYVTSLDQTSGGASVPTLHAFDINPEEDLNQDDNPDDGDTIAGTPLPYDPTTNIPYTQDFSAGINYDELWAAQITGADRISAPTIAAIPSGAYGAINSTGYYDTVIVEDQSGNVYLYDATSNPQTATPAALKKITSGSTTKFSGNYVPSPVYSHGWLIAPQPANPTSGASELLVYFGDPDVAPTMYKETLDNTGAVGSGATDTSDVVSTPAIAMVPSLDTKYSGSDIVAYLATQQAVYPQFLGSRDEEVMSSSGQTNDFQTKLSSIEGAATSTTAPIQGVLTLRGAPEDQFGPTDSKSFTYLSDTPDWATGSSGLEHVPNFRTGSFNLLDLTVSLLQTDGSTTTAFADYDVVPGGAFSGGTTASGTATLSRHQIVAGVGGQTASTTVEGIAVGDDDTLYMTVNEKSGAYIEAVQEQNPLLNSTSSNGTLIKWRYSIGDNSSYAPSGLNSIGTGTNDIPHFVGAPVVDRNHVYALATDSTGDNAYVLCFNHNANFTLVTGTISEGSVTLQQTDENGNVNTLEPSQFNITDSQTGTVAITDFAPQTSSVYTIWPNLSVSIPITTNLGDNNPANTSTSINSDSSGSGLLAWCSVAIPRGKLAASNTRAVPGALREFGSYLYFSNGVGNVGGVPASQLSSVSNDSGGANPNPNVTDAIQLNSSTFVTGALAASGTSVIGAGTGGIVGMAYTGTVVADSNRLIEYAPDGSPMWALDSTTQQAPVLDTTNPASPTVATTNVSLSRPSSVTMLASNDILFADTGNNRCVRVDRGGGVLWELNSFNDPTGLLAPGQPLTLNDPTSVVEWRETYTDTTVTPSNRVTIEHYLVADAGNYRVLEIDDIYTNGNIYTTDPREYHVLRWVSHTFDQAGRNYRYTYASRYYNGANSTATAPEILAGVANRQIAPLIKQSPTATPYLDSAARDTAGSSIVLLNYALPAIALNTFTPPATAATPNPGSVNVYQAPIYSAAATQAFTAANPVNGLPSALFTQIIYKLTPDATSTVTIPIRNLRYVNAYFPTGQTNLNNSPGENIILCDDDGVFDGIAYGSNATANFSIVAATGVNPGNGTLPNTVGFSFTETDYNTLTSVSSNYAPKNVFTPTSAQRLDSGDYLITNGASTGDAAPLVNAPTAIDVTNNLLHFGGDVFEVNYAKVQVGTTFGRQGTSPVQSSSNSVSTTAPLSLPAYAVRSQ